MSAKAQARGTGAKSNFDGNAGYDSADKLIKGPEPWGEGWESATYPAWTGPPAASAANTPCIVWASRSGYPTYGKQLYLKILNELLSKKSLRNEMLKQAALKTEYTDIEDIPNMGADWANSDIPEVWIDQLAAVKRPSQSEDWKKAVEGIPSTPFIFGEVGGEKGLKAEKDFTHVGAMGMLCTGGEVALHGGTRVLLGSGFIWGPDNRGINAEINSFSALMLRSFSVHLRPWREGPRQSRGGFHRATGSFYVLQPSYRSSQKNRSSQIVPSQRKYPPPLYWSPQNSPSTIPSSNPTPTPQNFWISPLPLLGVLVFFGGDVAGERNPKILGGGGWVG